MMYLGEFKKDKNGILGFHSNLPIGFSKRMIRKPNYKIVDKDRNEINLDLSNIESIAPIKIFLFYEDSKKQSS
jgi:hypothetical protein